MSNLLAFKWVTVVLLTVAFLSSSPGLAAGPSLLFDLATGDVLSQDRAGEPWYPASLTKLMTAYIVFEKLRSRELALDEKVAVSAIASAQPPSKIGVPVGGRVTVRFALEAMLVYSANDMAYVLAEAASGSARAFTAEMNNRARYVGMTGTHFVNPNGLHDPRHISTARDISLLVSALLRDFPEHAHYYAQRTVAVGKRKLVNRNSLLRQMTEADGMKTGFVCNSGFNLVATATRVGRKLGAVILGANSGRHRADLAEMLLVDGFSRKIAHPSTIASIQNMKTGAIVPADMTKTVCKQKPFAMARAEDIGGWGISFGNYDSPATADMALRGRLISQAGLALPGTPGLVPMPGKAGYAAALWNLDQQTSLAACAMYRAENAPCEVIPPETFAQMAALLRDPPAGPAPSTSQGADTGKAQVPIRKSKKRQKK